MKRILCVLLLALISATTLAQQRVRPDGTGGWIVDPADPFSAWGPGASGTRQAEIDRQNELLRQEQIRNQQLQNELLRRQLQQQQSVNQSSPPPKPQIDYSKDPVFQNWLSENPWYGTDRPRTEFAELYAKQLRQERPTLVGRPFLDAITAKINETFGVAR